MCFYMEHKTTQRAFTLVELITVIVILGFLSVAILPRFLQSDSFEARTVQDKLISAAREAQQLAMSKAVSANVQLITDNSNKRIRIRYSEGGTQTIDTDIPSASSISDQTLGYNKRGYLSSGSGVNISINGGARTVRIEASGYAHAL
jgi:prepilin-type N-terminal cleavage/methylation domain-containing protein